MLHYQIALGPTSIIMNLCDTVIVGLHKDSFSEHNNLQELFRLLVIIRLK